MDGPAGMRLTIGLCALIGLIGSIGAHASPQEPSVRELSSRIHKERDDVEHEVFDQLASIGTDAALRALERGIDRLKEEESLRAAFGAFRLFAGRGELEGAALEALHHHASRSKLEPARHAAARTMVHFADAALPYLERILARNKDPVCRQIACDPLVPLLAKRADPDSVRLILEHASLGHEVGWTYIGLAARKLAAFEGQTHREVVAASLAGCQGAEAQAALVEFLHAERASRALKLVLIDILAKREGPEITQALAGATKDRESAVVLTALEILGDRHDWDGLGKALHPLIGSRESSVRRAAVAALGKVAVTDEKWRAELLGLARSKDPALRMGAASALADARTLEAVERLHALLSDRDWSVRVEALQQVGRLRRKNSIPFLIDRLGAERGRLVRDVYAVLRLLTGLDLGILPTRWRMWWDKESETFELPGYDAARQVEDERNAQGSPEGTAARSYHGVQVVSERVCFVLDVSGSMRKAQGSTNEEDEEEEISGPTRMEVAKEELSNAIRRLEEGTLFNIIFFETQVRAWRKKMVKMNKANRQQALRFISEQYALGSTALYPALRMAFGDPLIDTIYLLSDGAPTEGEITDIAEIRAEVRRWNSARHVKIHGITMGHDSTLLWWLTQDTGGRYICVD